MISFWNCKLCRHFCEVYGPNLGREVLEFTTVYIDEILITSTTWEEHCQHIEMVLRRLAENNITLKLDKSIPRIYFIGDRNHSRESGSHTKFPQT